MIFYYFKVKRSEKISEIVKSLHNEVINTLPEDILNGLCGKIILNVNNIKKLNSFKKLMKLFSNKSINLSKKKKLMTSKKRGALLNVLLPPVISTIAGLIK